ncbi:MAG: hypothetical protein HOY79_49705 [Streptomyces sp.]|nr:hypothetical protein [Streptomyces sp.]
MAPQQQPASGAPYRYMQGVSVPATSVRPKEFFARTRRHTVTEANRAWNGLGGQDVFELKKADILDRLYLRVYGSVTSTPGTGTVATTRRWPYDLARQIRFTANGASNLINANGSVLVAREFTASPDRDDRGVPQSIGGATVTQGTMSKSCEAWGVGSGQTAIAAGTYNFDFSIPIPVAENGVDLAGAIYCASSSTDLTLMVDWESATNMFTLTGNGAVSMTATVELTSVRYSIPMGADGQIVVPDLSVFHSIVKTATGTLSNGQNETRLVGQGAGKTLLRVLFRTLNGAQATAVPLVVNAANYGEQGIRFSANETPDDYFDGQVLRYINERAYNSDLGMNWGYAVHDFAAENAFRDAIDMGTTSELRLLTTIQGAVGLVTPSFEYTQETIFAAGTGA